MLDGRPSGGSSFQHSRRSTQIVQQHGPAEPCSERCKFGMITGQLLCNERQNWRKCSKGLGSIPCADLHHTSCPGGPARSLGRLACVDVHLLQAVLAAHRAAPVELALAFGHPADTQRVVATAAAHHLTAVHAAGGLVAHPASRSWRACRGKAAVT